MGPRFGIGLLSAALLAAPALAQPRRAAAPRLALIGVTQIGDRTEAWLVDRNTKERATVGPGSTAFGYKVRKIEPEAVVLARGGSTVRVRLGQPEMQTATTGSAASHLHARRRPATGATEVMESDPATPDISIETPAATPPATTSTDARTYNTAPQPAPAPTYVPSYPSYPVYSNSSLITPQAKPAPNPAFAPNGGFYYPDQTWMGSMYPWTIGPDGEPWVTPWGTTAPNSTYYPDTSGLLPELRVGRRSGLFTGVGASMGVPSPKVNPQTLRRRQQLGIR